MGWKLNDARSQSQTHTHTHASMQQLTVSTLPSWGFSCVVTWKKEKFPHNPVRKWPKDFHQQISPNRENFNSLNFLHFFVLWSALFMYFVILLISLNKCIFTHIYSMSLPQAVCPFHPPGAWGGKPGFWRGCPDPLEVFPHFPTTAGPLHFLGYESPKITIILSIKL